ncbi:MAG TPA: ABC transporter permease [Acidobacteriaceae bacterium]|nr:ABC transporter permease [Acidobacteriaceae bacterium]
MRIFLDRLRQVLRRLGRAPLFTALTLITLAVGIGATTLIFSVVDGVLLKPLPYPQPGRLIGVWYHTPKVAIKKLNMAPFLYFISKEQNKTLEAIGAYTGDSLSVTGTGQPEHVRGLDVTYEVLSILGVKPALGRLFSQKDDTAGSSQTVMLSYAYWQKKFGGAQSVIGQSITADGKPREIIGVLPKGFHFLNWQDAAMIVPLQWDRSKVKLGNFSYEGLARLKPGMTMAEASADLQRLIPIAIRSFPPPPGFSAKLFEAADFRTDLHPLKQDVVGDVGNVLWVLMGSIVMVLLIACANVANLLLVRVEGRRQELAIRSALGAGWRRIASELLFESVVLTLMGSLLGLGLAYAGLRVLLARTPDLPRIHDIGINVPVLLFTLALAVATGLLIGLIPVFKFAGGQVNVGLREGGRAQSQSRERHRTRSVLVVVQVALALVLLICSGLMIRTFRALEHVNAGFTNPNSLQTFRIWIPDTQIPDKDADKLVHMEQAMMEKMAALPGVTSVSLTSSVPMAGYDSNDLIFAADHTYREGEIPPIRRFNYVAPGFFKTMGTPIVAGRSFTWEDNYDELPVAIVSQNFAREYWGSAQNALGKRIREGPKDDWRQIVGVVGNVHADGVTEKAPTTVYWPLMMKNFEMQKLRVLRGVAFVIRAPQAGSQAFMPEVRQAVWSVDSDLPLANPRTVGYYYTQSMARTSFTLVMLAVAGAMALLLGMVGIYGVISYSVSQRTKEIGIRMALGSPRQAIVGLFVRDGLKLAAIGIACGLIAAFAAMRLMASLLYGVSAYDPLTYAVITVGIFVTVWVACWLPSQKAATVDPMHALRAE